jgi:Mrp family chromosome partitioning ATPase/LPS O-antigen subunit length determinant protein (WzzB/FepE family)
MNRRFTAPGFARTPPPADGDLVDLRRLFVIARRQFRAALLCTLAGTALGLAWLAAATPLYTATATLFINPLAGASVAGGAVAGALAPVVAVGMFDSEAGILLSEKIAADAFAAIDPEWLATSPSPVARLKRMLRPGLASPEALRQALLDHLRARFAVERPEAAFLLDLSYTSSSPEHAAAILDAFIGAYLGDRAERRRKAADAASAAVAAQIGDLESRLAAAARAVREHVPGRAGDPDALADARRRADADSTALGQLLVREQEIRTLTETADDGVRVVSPPRVPVFDSSPNAARTLLLSTIAGVLLGVGVSLVREGSERGFRTAGQVRRELGIPCLALLPAADARVGDDPARSEALSAVKLALDQAIGTSRPKLVGFAPAAAGDGATATARDFAALLAGGGATTLLLDADLRDGGLTAELDLAGQPGFADTVSGGDVAPVEGRSGLSILPAGNDRSAAAAAVALGTPQVGEALARAAVPFDFAVVDLPPLDRFVDARAMARHLDGLVIVARWRRTERRQLRALLAADRDLRQRTVGVILNRAAPAAADRYDDDLAGEEVH